MSAAKENPCRKFQANIFNKSKCQNCFKPRESHLLNDEDLTQVSGLGQGFQSFPKYRDPGPAQRCCRPWLEVPGRADALLGVARSRPRWASVPHWGLRLPPPSPDVRKNTVLLWKRELCLVPEAGGGGGISADPWEK